MRPVVYVASQRSYIADQIQAGLGEYPAEFFNGSGYPSFAKLVNDITMHCPTEIVIIASSKVRPTSYCVEQMIELLDKGYGFVGLYRFGFFGFKKDLIRKIGFMDERYLGGNCEDADFLLRLLEANIAIFEAESTIYHKGTSSWDHTAANKHHKKKWGTGKKKQRRLIEEKYDYDPGPSQGTKFLPFDKSEMLKITKKWLK
jgi:GT2 family glycosyltransferase